jgi:hypothetical protein
VRALGGAGDVALPQERGERAEKVEVDPGYIHFTHSDYVNYVVDE